MKKNLSNDPEFWQKFWKRVERTNTCWLWKPPFNGYGYGTIRLDGKPIGVHRVSYEKFKNKIPDNLQIDHLCRVRNCVNPDHLEVVTQKENFDRWIKTKTHCIRGHKYTPENTRIYKGKTRHCRLCDKLRYRKNGKKIKLSSII